MLSSDFINELQVRLSDIYDTDIIINNSMPVSGGDINDAYKLVCEKHSFFIKLNKANKFPMMFETEAKGLDLLASSQEIDVPKVVLTGKSEDYAFLIQDYIKSELEMDDYWIDFGTRLARMHKHTNESFGLDYDNYIGSLPQNNAKHNSWNEFFINERMIPQINMARGAGLMSKPLIRSFESLFAKIQDIFPEEPPALLHGDLWSGNFMTGNHGQAVIIDPAVYYGHREMDIGMTRLFGGFSFEFYDAYNEEYPLQPGWEDRIEICNLYPLMVHVNLFGGGYLGSVENILSKYV
ncbi:fructosamine kinase family protein [Bacteroidota bacterium]